MGTYAVDVCPKDLVSDEMAQLLSILRGVLHHDLVNPYNVAVSRIVSDVFASDAP